MKAEHLHRYLFARSLCRELDVLVLASREGAGSVLLAQVAKSVIDVEIDAKAFGHADGANGEGTEFARGDVQNIPCEDESIDAVVSFEVKANLFEDYRLFAEIRRVLRPGGFLIISSPKSDVYPPADRGGDPHGVKELTRTEFRKLILGSFRYVTMYQQRPVLGSALTVETPDAQTGRLLTDERLSEKLFEASVGLSGPAHLIAVVSDTEIVINTRSLYLETNGVETLFADHLSAEQEIRAPTEREIQEGGYAPQVQAELTQRDEQLVEQMWEVKDWHEQLVARTADRDAMDQEISSLSERLLAGDVHAQSIQSAIDKREEKLTALEPTVDYCRQQLDADAKKLKARDLEIAGLPERACLAQADLSRSDNESGEFSGKTSSPSVETDKLHAQLAAARLEVLRRQADMNALATRNSELGLRLQEIMLSKSWRLTAPLRAIALRCPEKLVALRSFMRRNTGLFRFVLDLVRLACRALSSHRVLSPAPPSGKAEPPAGGFFSSPGSTSPPAAAVPAFRPSDKVGRMFVLKSISTPIRLTHLAQGGGRRAICFGHVLPCPPRAGNEYRIHRLLSWLAGEGWNPLVVICPLPDEAPSEAQLASAAEAFPNLIVCGHDGVLHHTLAADDPVLNTLQPFGRIDVAALLGEDDGGSPERARFLHLCRRFCPDTLVELLLQLQDRYQPELVLAEYVFMTRPFSQLRASIVTAVDTIEMFSTKASRVEMHGVNDSLAMIEAEEAALLRRADILIAIQPDEARSLVRLAPDATVVEIGVDFSVREPEAASDSGPTVLLVASASPMNIVGLQSFLREAWPTVLRAVPDAELLLVGAIGESVNPLPGRVRMLGKIDDLRPWYASAQVVINPAAGAGLNIKTIEAICHLRPLVCWPAGVDGVPHAALPFCHVVDDWRGFADEVIRFLEDNGAAQSLEQNAQILRELFSSDHVYAPLRVALENAARRYQLISGEIPPVTTGCDVFVDLSTSDVTEDMAVAHIRRLKQHGGFSEFTGQLTVAMPSDPAPVATWSHAVADAALKRRHLLVVLGLLPIEHHVIAPLLQAVNCDPVVATAQPRFSNTHTDAVWALPGLSMSSSRTTSRAGMDLLPPTLLTAEMLAACTLIHNNAVAAIEPAEGFGSVIGALAHCQTQNRRRGLRNIVANHVIVPSLLPFATLYPLLPAKEAAELAGRYPDTTRAALENDQSPQRLLEQVLSEAYPAVGEPRRLLLDCRGSIAVHNGTSQCMLGILDGFAASERNWHVTVLCNYAASHFHGLPYRYPQFEHLSEVGSRKFAAAYLLNQPWHLHTVSELHRNAFQVGFNILDTIAWDIIFAAPAGLGDLWGFVGRHADVLTFISKYSQERFRHRFPVSPSVSEAVIYPSLVSEEKTLQPFRDLPKLDHVLLFGNDYDHKGIGPALNLLVAAFPYQRFVVVGSRLSSSEMITHIPSGALSMEEIHHLVSTAQAIVYPSFYEGFGLPVTEGLAYNCPVLVRRSALWAEIAARSRFQGPLIEFDDRASLVEMLRQVLYGRMPAGLPLGGALGPGQAPPSWRGGAEALLDVFEARLALRSAGPWYEREKAIRMART